MKTAIVFGISAILILVFGLFIKRKMRQNGAKVWVRVVYTLVLLVVFGLLVFQSLFPTSKELETTGPYQVASEDYWVKEDREDPYKTDRSMRELQVRRWYPVDTDGKEIASAGDIPVIIASHGSCGTIDNNLSLYRELASQGYTVLAVGHPGQAASVTHCDESKEGPASQFIKQMTSIQPNKNAVDAYMIFEEWMDIRMYDLNVVMDDYESWRGQTNFVAMGHSAGGSAAYGMARVRDDVIGVIALESPFMYDIERVDGEDFIFNEEDYNVPLLNIYSRSSYKYLHEWKQYKNNAKFLDSKNDNYTNIYYDKVGHMGLCDLSKASPLLASLLDGGLEKVDADTQLARINRECLKWLSNIQN